MQRICVRNELKFQYMLSYMAVIYIK